MSPRVLIAEDSPTQAEQLLAALESEGYEVTLARNGEKALESFVREPPDLVVSDVVMPGAVNGFELCRSIKQGQRRDVPVMLLTSLSDPMDIIRGLEAGADNFLTKPYDPAHLLDRLRLLLATHRGRREGRVHADVTVHFLGREFHITSEREQILDLLISTFEDAVLQNRELRQRERELTLAKEQLARYAGTLQGQLQGIIDNSPTVVYVKDTSGRYLLVNREFERLFGVLGRDAAGRTDEECLPPPIAAALGAHDRDVLRSGSNREFDLVVAHNGELRTYLTVKFPLVDPGGQTYAVCGISADITERKRAEEALQARARQQAAVAELGHRALTAPDLKTLMDEALARAAETLEAEYAEVFELRFDAKRLVLRAGVGWQQEHVGQASVPAGEQSQAGYTLMVGEPVIVRDQATEGRFQPTTLDGVAKLEGGVSVVIGGRPRPYGVLAVHTAGQRTFGSDDAHFLQAIANVLAAAIERDRAERDLGQAQRLEAVGSLAGGVAHDFNNLLTVISASSEFALEGLPPESSVRDDVTEIKRAADRAAALTRQLLAFSRRQLLQPVVLNVNDVVAGVGNMLGRLLREDIKLQTVLEPGLPSVKADPGQLEQVIVNLVINARDAMPLGGSLVIETATVELDDAYVEQHPGASAGRHVMIAVTDTGVGMDRETQAHVFEPFFTTKGEAGTGLGLATVHGIVKQSGGSIWVYSEVSQGTAFKVYLPATEATPTPRPAGSADVIGGSETILLVEDDASVRRLAERVLAGAGYHVLTAGSGQAAMDVEERHRGTIHLLLSDLVLPDLRGTDVADRMAPKRPGTHVLFMSGYMDPALLPRHLVDKGARLVHKPFSKEVLLRRVREALDQAAEP